MNFDYSDFLDAREQIDAALLNQTYTKKKIAAASGKLEIYQAELEAAKTAQVIFREVSHSLMLNVQERLSQIVSLGLRVVFPDPPDFVVQMVFRRDVLECDLLFRRGDELFRPVGNSGGGLLDVASFALRVAYWALDKTAPIFILDEPFKFVSPDLQERVEQMLRVFCEELGVQIIMVSHSDYVCPESSEDKVYLMKQRRGVTKMEVLQ